MPLENNYNDMSRLNNAGPANDPVVTTVNKNIDLGRDYYFELDFKGKMKKLDYIRFETFAGTLGQQNITKVDVDYYDSSDGTWKNDVTNEVIEWNKVNEAAESAFG
ncbi:MAG: hypothetical protein RSC29_02430, partial [Oscillospiraceae bacterium]